jgi:KaiC/GvpD/RAD55 family RecA-like ATPase
MSKEIINFYEKLNIKGNKLPKHYKHHGIMHNSMILALGGTGTGKTNALLNYIKRSSVEFSDVIVCSFSTVDEPLYNLLEENDATLYNNIDEVPELIEYDDDDKKNPNNIIFFMISSTSKTKN